MLLLMSSFINFMQLLKVMVHPETVRSFTYVKTMHGLVFITNSGTDMRSYMNIWNLQGEIFCLSLSQDLN